MRKDMKWYAVVGFECDAYLHHESYEVQFYEFNLVVHRACQKEHSLLSNQVIVETTLDREKEAHNAILKFLSEISWKYQVAIFSAEHGSGSLPIPVSSKFYGQRSRQKCLDLSEHDSSERYDERQWLAIGMFKEAISNNSPFFRFLGYFRILELTLNASEKRIQWFNTYFKKLGLKENLKSESPYFPDKLSRLSSELKGYARNGAAHGMNPLDSNLLFDYAKTDLYCGVIKGAAEHYMLHDLKITR